MTIILVLILLALGIAASQAVSAARAVTLHWLRLGDLIALSLLAGASVLILTGYVEGEDGGRAWPVLATLLLGAFVHLMVVQLGYRRAERVVIAVSTVAASVLLMSIPLHLGESLPTTPPAPLVHLACLFSPVLAAWLTGGSLMTMLLGHAYLTAGGEMTQRPFLRLTRLIFAGIILRAALVLTLGVGLWYRMYSTGGFDEPQTWNAMLILARVSAGLIVPGVLMWMVIQCVKIHSNQSATGIMYVASVLLLIGELTALSLIADTGLAF